MKWVAEWQAQYVAPQDGAKRTLTSNDTVDVATNHGCGIAEKRIVFCTHTSVDPGQ